MTTEQIMKQQKVNDKEFFANTDEIKLNVTDPTLIDIVGKENVDIFNNLVKKYSKLKGSIDGLNSEVDYGMVGTITNHVIYENKPFKTFRAGIASVAIAKAAIKIMEIAKSKGVNLKIGYTNYMPIGEEYKFQWTLADASEILDIKLNEKGKELFRNLIKMGSRYPGFFFDDSTIVQP